MLIELSIRNFAIIKELRISFFEGFHVMTGETGAGKSIIIDALSLLLGGRGSQEYVKHNEEKAEIEGLFELRQGHTLLSLLDSYGIQMDEDDLLIVKREINKQGKSIIRINGQLVTLAMLKEVGPQLLHIHGQHEHQELLKSDKHLAWLDHYAGLSLFQLKREYRHLFDQYKALIKELKELTANEQSLIQRLDLLQYQLNEIQEARLIPNEDEILMQKKQKLVHREKIYHGVNEAYQYLSGEQKGLEWIGQAVSSLESILYYDETLREIFESLQSSYYIMEDVASELRRYIDSMDFESNELQEIEERVHLISTLKRKYGSTVNDVLEYADRIKKELDMIQHKDLRIGELKTKIETLEKRISQKAKELTGVRKKVAQQLEKAVLKELFDLHMEKTKFSVSIISEENPGEFTSDGRDKVEFLISPNPGEPLRPLAKIASGGELSRIVLALKRLLADADQVDTIIFDEVDTGISGRVAQSVAEKLALVAKNRQVICITHLPQVASFADVHYTIIKQMTRDDTYTSVRQLTEDERIEELARMLGGAEVSDVTRQHAKELLERGNEIKLRAM
ncbi:DNA repair protein RecN [Microaerobacter geothermalis]|nr:DNA repair protein RecN [Microaerobacter geothermalis]